jgi:hypothetical protein
MREAFAASQVVRESFRFGVRKESVSELEEYFIHLLVIILQFAGHMTPVHYQLGEHVGVQMRSFNEFLFSFFSQEVNHQGVYSCYLQLSYCSHKINYIIHGHLRILIL